MNKKLEILLKRDILSIDTGSELPCPIRVSLERRAVTMMTYFLVCGAAYLAAMVYVTVRGMKA